MLMQIHCPQCLEGSLRGEGTGIVAEWAELDDRGHLRLVCARRGHRTLSLLDARHYEILMESASRARQAGFANEAISTLNTALERCYEHYVRVVCRHRQLDVRRVWNQVSRQSERQLGVFLAMFLVQEEEAFIIPQPMVELRNAVVHKGKLATRADADRFARDAFGLIRRVETALAAYDIAVLQERVGDHEERKANLEGGWFVQTLITLTRAGREAGDKATGWWLKHLDT